MRVVEVRVPRSGFIEAMGAMRDWLDRNHCPHIRFETATDSGDILISIEFPTEDMAAAFRRQFGEALPEAA